MAAYINGLENIELISEFLLTTDIVYSCNLAGVISTLEIYERIIACMCGFVGADTRNY